MTEGGKFEVGDTVRCIKATDSDEYPIEVGTVFTISHIPTSSIIRRIREDYGECFRAELFELVQLFGEHKLLKRKKHEI